MHGGLQAIAVWTQVPIASRTITLPAGSYSVRASSTQRGSVDNTGVATNTATISSVTTTRATEHKNGNDFNSTALNEGLTQLTLTNATTITVSKRTATSNTTTQYAVAEFF